MKNYDKMTQYAKKFVGDYQALDLVHDLWLKYKVNGVDLLDATIDLPILFAMVRTQFHSNLRRKNAKTQDQGTESIETINETEHPLSVLESSNVDELITRDLKLWVINKINALRLCRNHMVKYEPENIMQVYELTKTGLSGLEISKKLGFNGNKAVVEFLSVIKYISKKYLSPTEDPSSIEAFMDNLDKTETCWNWKSGLTFRVKGVSMDPQKAAYTLFKGEISTGYKVFSTCSNPSCVNPDHLSVDTHKNIYNKKVADGLVEAKVGARVHPSFGAYRRGCRCEECKAINRLQVSKYRDKKKMKETVTFLKPNEVRKR